MSGKNPHLIKQASLFAMFCLSYLPLLFLLAVKVIIKNFAFLNYGGFNNSALWIFLEKFGFVTVLILFAIFAAIGTTFTLKNIKRKKSNAFPAKISSIKPKNEEALSYLATYVLPLLVQGEIGTFEYITFAVLFGIYYKLYSTSSLILINPVLNIKYGLYEVEYATEANKTVKNALIISQHKWINEDDDLRLIKLSHRLYFAF